MANLFVQVNDQRGRPIDRCRVVLALVGRSNPDGTLENDDKVTREGGNVSWLGNWIPIVDEYEIRVNTYEPLAGFTNLTRRVTRAEFEHAQVFALRDTGEQQPPADGPQKVVITHDIDAPGAPLSSEARAAYDQWKAGYYAEAARVGVTTNSEANRAKMIPWCVLNGCKFQNQDRGDTRARLFLAPRPDAYVHTVNLGDDAGFGSAPAGGPGGPLKWEVAGQV